MKVKNPLVIPESSSPGTPASGTAAIYSFGGNLFLKDDGGVVHPLIVGIVLNVADSVPAGLPTDTLIIRR